MRWVTTGNSQPEPTYHTLRTLSTVLDGARPADVNVEVSNQSRDSDICGFTQGQGLLVGI